MDQLEHLQEKAAARIGQLVPKDWKVDRLVVEHYSDSQAVLHYRLTSQRPNDQTPWFGAKCLMTLTSIDKALSDDERFETLFARSNLERRP